MGALFAPWRQSVSPAIGRDGLRVAFWLQGRPVPGQRVAGRRRAAGARERELQFATRTASGAMARRELYLSLHSVSTSRTGA